MPTARHDLSPSAVLAKYGLPGRHYPTNNKAAYAVVIEEVPIRAQDYAPLAFYTPHAGTGLAGIAAAILTEETVNKGDGTTFAARRVYETLPGPPRVTSRIDPEDGSLIIETKRDVRTDTAGPAVASGTTSTTYEPRGDSLSVSVQTTRTTAYDGVVRSLPARVNLHLPRTLAGIAVSYNIQKGVGDDASNGRGESDQPVSYSINASASARASSSLNVTPEVYLPLRDRQDEAEATPATIKQVYLSGAITEAAMLTKLTAVYEVAVSGIAAPGAGNYLGNASNVNGVIWFSGGSYDANFLWVLSGYSLQWEAGIWKLGTVAGILAGNYWKRTAAATAWLGTYAPQGTASGTATVAVGRTVAMMPRWGTQEVNLIAAGEQASVSSNASASASRTVNADGESKSYNTGAGFSVSRGGNQSRVRVEPTLHGAITIARSGYTDTVNATASAVLSGTVTGGTPAGTGINSGFSPTHAQTVHSYVRIDATPISATPTAKTISAISVESGALTIVTTTTPHQLGSGDSAVISGTDSTPLIDGTRVVTFVDATRFSVAVDVTVAGSHGSVQGPAINAATTIPPTVPTDTPSTGIWCLPQYESAGKDAIWTTIHATIVDMTIFATAPIGLGYSDPAATYAQGLAIVANQPFYRGGGAPTSYSVSGASPFPAGLAFNATTGIITGAPTSGQVATAYVVTATNGAGSANTTISIAISVG